MKLLTVFACLATVLAQTIRPTIPSEDDFYNAPSNLTSYDAGDIIDFRRAPNQVRSLFTPLKVENAWQLLVKSQNARGEPIAMVTTVLVPYNADPSKLVSYQYAQDSATMDCAPSYSLLYRGEIGTFVQQAETLLVQALLTKGWYVVLPDYEGPDGAFTSGWQAGYATVDSIRAALSSKSITGISPNADTALWGFSGGSFASTWGASVQPEYAPDLKENLVGAALGGWVTNWTDVIAASDGTTYAGLVPNILNGMIKSNPDLKEVFDAEFKEDRRKELYSRTDDCVFTSFINYLNRDIFGGDDPWTEKGWDFFKIPEIKEAVLNNSIGVLKDTPRPEIPLFLYHGTPDQIVPFNGSQKAYENFCEWGIDSLEFAVSETSGHLLEATVGNGAALAWLERMLNGEEPVKGCNRTVRSTNVLYPGADVQLSQVISTIPSSARGSKIGEETPNKTDSSLITRIFQQSLGGVLGLIGPIPLR
ncbi:hypothetical protein FT663_04113 [Candidozyma haemuli var. vulneris]|uniref:Triacylglycerol lipase n=1 Tax=Candidozyma haemuli TaxID=45357 RepID=A0A2V1AZQ2_9ASCO|nr:hypothetical protein CXQ85_004929 [[Candida] haemuloni]KAF3986950.1 hypothetical protein FT662_04270 [[Candida] haemuloni var. vulneris]KAF3988228.1 hypothetical protein FT663_04113 [[Candida] haemuloni var. vulneris]PVH22361.1 hypothetical protein CXQ85_004929 [[Candida] haemuloni]